MGKKSKKEDGALKKALKMASKIKLIITLGGILIIAALVMVLFDGIINKIDDFFRDAKILAEDEMMTEALLGDVPVLILKINDPIDPNNEGTLEAYKAKLINSGVNLEACGMTEVRLRKMLLASAASTSFSDTVCVAELTEQDILDNFKEREFSDDTIYQNISEMKADTTNIKQLQSVTDNVWRGDDTSDYNYTLYYEPSKYDNSMFFYFYDENCKFENSAKWYIGIMGSTSVVPKDSDGNDLTDVDRDHFEELFETFKGHAQDLLVDNSSQKKDQDIDTILALPSFDALKHVYTKKDDHTMTVYEVTTYSIQYNYLFKNKNIKESSSKSREKGQIKLYDYETEYAAALMPKIDERDIDLRTTVDMDRYALSDTLLTNLLNVTGSGGFIEEFIDYALTQTSVTINAYCLANGEENYDINKYNIKNDFIMEMYDMDDTDGFEITMNGIKIGGLVIDWGTLTIDGLGEISITWDHENHVPKLNFDLTKKLAVGDNFAAYYDIIFNRKYNGSKIGKVTSISNFKDVTKNNSRYNGKTVAVLPLHNYLKCAYDPKSDFSLGSIDVMEHISTIAISTTWEVSPSKIETWYGDFSYSDATVDKEYTIPSSSSPVDKTTFDNFDYEDVINLGEYESKSDETKIMIYLDRNLYNQLGNNKDSQLRPGKDEAGDGFHLVDSNDLYDNAMQTKPGKQGKSHYWNWNMNGLAAIAQEDGGKYNDDFGAGVRM